MTSQPPAQGTPSGLQWFSRPISLARVPEQAADQGSQLVFASTAERDAQAASCRAKVAGNCLKGARQGCSVQARRKCRPHPLLLLLGLVKEPSWEETDACERSFMQACVQQGEASCQQHAEGYCAQAFAGPVLQRR